MYLTAVAFITSVDILVRCSEQPAKGDCRDTNDRTLGGGRVGGVLDVYWTRIGGVLKA